MRYPWARSAQRWLNARTCVSTCAAAVADWTAGRKSPSRHHRSLICVVERPARRSGLPEGRRDADAGQPARRVKSQANSPTRRAFGAPIVLPLPLGCGVRSQGGGQLLERQRWQQLDCYGSVVREVTYRAPPLNRLRGGARRPARRSTWGCFPPRSHPRSTSLCRHNSWHHLATIDLTASGYQTAGNCVCPVGVPAQK